MYSRTQRQLNDKEVRALRSALNAAKTEKRAASKRAILVGPVIIGVLWILTVLAVKDLPAPYVTLFWLLVGIPICVAAGTSAVRPHTKRIARIEDALACSRADECRISTEAMVELEEIEDEGACYAFQVEEDTIVFVCGQDFSPGPKFPSSDFSIVRVMGQNDELVDLMVEKRGSKLRPLRTIPAGVKRQLRTPGHLEILPGRLDALERILESTPPSSGGPS